MPERVEPPVFRNRPNERLVLSDGREIWHSRSVAVVGTVVARHGDRDHVALVERGPGLPDEVGKLCLPCGYLDWDESALEAARREIYEETGLDVSRWAHDTDPWRVLHQPTGRQNVALHFAFQATMDRLPALTNEHVGADEVTRAIWLPIEEAIALELAFGHEHVLRAFRSTRAG